MPRHREMAAYYRDGYFAFHKPKFECSCYEIVFWGVCCVIQNLYAFSLYSNPDLDDPIFYCLLTSMPAVQAEDVRASFLFADVLNGSQQEWFGSTIANRHGVTTIDFATVSGCDQFVVGPTLARGGTFDLLMTDILDLVRVAVVAPIGNADHSSL